MSTEEIIAIISKQAGRSFDAVFHKELITRVTLWRARLLRDSLNKRIQDRRFYLQSIYDDLENAKEPKYGLITKEKFRIKRSVKKIPSLIRANNILFDYVGDFHRHHAFGYMPTSRLAYLEYNDYSPNNKFMFVSDYIYMVSSMDVDEYCVEAIFSDPRELKVFNNPDGSACYSDDNYPIDAALAQRVAEYIVRFDLNRLDSGDQEITLDNEKIRS